MAIFTDPAPPINLEVLDFETDFEQAFQQAVAAHNELIPAAQGDNKTLLTPRIEVEFVNGQQQLRSYVVPGTNTGNTTPPTAWRYPNEWTGSLKVIIKTNRLEDGGKAYHRRLRALVRQICQRHDVEISARMKYLTAIQIIESGTSREFVANTDTDMSGITFAVQFNIHPSAFPTPK